MIQYLKVGSEVIYFFGFLLLIVFPVMSDSMSIPTYKNLGWAITYMFYLVLVVETSVLLATTVLDKREEKKRQAEERK